MAVLGVIGVDGPTRLLGKVGPAAVAAALLDLHAAQRRGMPVANPAGYVVTRAVAFEGTALDEEVQRFMELSTDENFLGPLERTPPGAGRFAEQPTIDRARADGNAARMAEQLRRVAEVQAAGKSENEAIAMAWEETDATPGR